MLEIEIDTDDCGEDYCNDESNVKEYNIYNSTGYVTSTNNLIEARVMSRQYGGRIVDENGITIH